MYTLAQNTFARYNHGWSQPYLLYLLQDPTTQTLITAVIIANTLLSPR